MQANDWILPEGEIRAAELGKARALQGKADKVQHVISCFPLLGIVMKGL